MIRRRQARSMRCRNGLIRFAKNVTSQNGEDGIIQRLFELIPTSSNIHWCVDVGAWNGVHLSNTYSLLVGSQSTPRKWNGVLIEADIHKYEELAALHQPLGNICLREEVSGLEHSPRSLTNLLQSTPKTLDGNELSFSFDFLCIDIDGSDYWVWHDFLTEGKYRPKVVCIEFNPTMPDDLVFIPCRIDNVRQGASLSALVELANRFDYILVETTLYNAFFVEASLYDTYVKDEVPDTSIEALHDISMGTSLYQLYDGTLKLWGCKKLLWHKVPLDENKLQIIGSGQRSFPFEPKLQPDNFDFSSVVDLAPYTQNRGSPEDRHAARKQCTTLLLDQLKKNGFCYVKGLELAQRTCQDALEQTSAFLQDASEDIRRSCLTKDRARRGYSPMNVENFASLIGENGPNDLVKKFRIGPLGPKHSGPLLQPNVWPSIEKWQKSDIFRSTMETFYTEMCIAGTTVVDAICEGLVAEFPELKQALNPLLSGPDETESSKTSILTLLSYQVTSRHKKARKKQLSPLVAAHTDVGVITILLFDHGDCATLQRSDGNCGWIDVKLPRAIPEDPVFVVNMADCFSDLTGGYVPSTLHRVVASDGTQPRNCCALFVGLVASTNLKVDEKPMTYEEWRKERIQKSQNVLQNKAKG